MTGRTPPAGDHVPAAMPVDIRLEPVPAGRLATIVTTLEMRERPVPNPSRAMPFRIARWTDPAPGAYRALFRRIGAPWLWFTRLIPDDAGLAAIIHDTALEIHVVRDLRGVEIGLIELDFAVPDSCEIAYFGVVPELAGKGLGGWMMDFALGRAWRPGIGRVWVHSCTFDHPAAVPFYRRSGFTVTGYAIESFADPRRAGLLPIDSAPQIALV